MKLLERHSGVEIMRDISEHLEMASLSFSDVILNVIIFNLFAVR